MNTPEPSGGFEQALELSAAYGELQNLLLQTPDMTAFLQNVADLAIDVVFPPAACGITLRHDHDIFTVAHHGELAAQADEIQYGRGQGPCLEALHTGTITHVPDLATETRWPDYVSHAMAHGVRSSLSLPLTVLGSTLGALNLYTAVQHPFSATEITQGAAFAAQAAAALALVLRQADHAVLQEQYREALASRAIIDQALGILMGQRQCTATQAFDVLRQASQHRNRKVQDIATELITTTTGQPPQPPRPFTHRP